MNIINFMLSIFEHEQVYNLRDRLVYIKEFDLRGLSKKFVEFANKNKSNSVVALKILHS